MRQFIWTKDYELGIDVIDRQHQRIVNYINDVYNVLQHGDREQLSEVLHNLTDYTFNHFAFEESLMEDAQYTALIEHQLAHDNFTLIINQLKQQFDQGEAVAETLAELLQEWLIKHILVEDIGYVEQVQEKLLGMQKPGVNAWLDARTKHFFPSN